MLFRMNTKEESRTMDEVYMLVSEGIVLEEFQSASAAQEFRDFMCQRHPEKRYCVVEDG
jgi:hypothetical protein